MSPRHILMLEYDEDDQYITREYLATTIPVTLVGSSDELWSFLENCLKKNKALPSLIMLTFNSSPLTSPELIRKIKSMKNFAHIPVIVLSGTKTDKIVNECYAAGASSFIQKPALVEDIRKKINAFVNYWFNTVEL